MDKFEYQPATFGADTVNMDGGGGYVGTAENVRSRTWARELGKSDLLSAARVAREVEVDFTADYATADALREAADADVLARTPGTFVAQGEWHQRGYVLASEPKGIHFGWVNTSLVIALLDGAWWRVRTLSYLPEPEPPVGKQYTTRTGEGIRAEGAAQAALHGLTVYGKCVQNGTPTCDNPVPIVGVQGDYKNLFGAAVEAFMTSSSGIMTLKNTGGGTCFVAKLETNTDYTISAYMYDGMNRFRVCLFDTDPRLHYNENYTTGHYSSVIITNDPATDQVNTFNSGSFMWVAVGLSTAAVAYNADAKAQCEAGTTATAHVERCLVLECGGTNRAYIDLNGEVLYGIPDPYNTNGNKYRDSIDVDYDGNVTLTKRTATVDLGSLTWPNTFTNDWRYPSSGYYSTVYVSEPITGMKASEPDGCYPVCTTASDGSPFMPDYTSLNKIRQNTVDDGTIYLSTNTGYHLNEYGYGPYYYETNPAGTAVIPLKESAWTTVSLGTITMPTVEDNWLVTINASVTPEITAEYELAQHITLDYPHDFPYDYTKQKSVPDVDTGRMVSCKPVIVFYGAVTDPEITVAGNKYKVTKSVPAGARIEIDGREHTVKMITSGGVVTDEFANALRGSGEGGGEYIFEPIPPGQHTITWDGSFGFDIGWYDEVGEPPWNQS